MRQKFFIFASIVVLLLILIGLNAASYVKKEQTPDTEMNPNRSTYNTGATGTRAFYDLLAETGRRVSRWQESTSALANRDKNAPDVFVFIGQERREITDTEIESLLNWVSGGGKLVLIDREPPTELLRTTANWKITADTASNPTLIFDPSNVQQMTEKTPAAKPLQPTVYTQQVNAVQSSRFASAITFERFVPTETAISDSTPKPAPTFSIFESNKTDDEDSYEAGETISDSPASNRTLPAKKEPTNGSGATITTTDNAVKKAINQPAPVAHLANQDKVLLADFPYGAGSIVFLSDPFIVSNGGINLVDNGQLALNLVSTDGIIAFDEFHQGFGAGQNRLLDYFAGTPLTAIALQIFALLAVILYSQSRRFARPLPADEPNRLSKLEYVGAMAELQQRTKAFDLAMENIYKDFRRRASRLVGADALKTPPAELAALIAERAKLNAAEVADTLTKCEAIMYGEPTNTKQMLDLTSRLRDIEEKLGLQRRKRQNTGN